MLVMKRRPGESISIGNSINVVYLGRRGDSIRLGVEAPRQIPVLRTEIIDNVSLQSPIDRLFVDYCEFDVS